MRSTAFTRWGAPLLLIVLGAGLSIVVASQAGRPRAVLPSTGVLTGLPATALAALLLVRASTGAAGRMSDLVVTLLVAFLIAIHILLVGTAVGLTARLDLAIPLATSGLFIALGPVVATVEPGSAMGLRTRATLGDADVWRRVHRRLGVAFAIAGVLGAGALFASPVAAIAVTGGLPLLAMLALARG